MTSGGARNDRGEIATAVPRNDGGEILHCVQNDSVGEFKMTVRGIGGIMGIWW